MAFDLSVCQICLKTNSINIFVWYFGILLPLHYVNMQHNCVDMQHNLSRMSTYIMHVEVIMLHVSFTLLHIDINKSHVNIYMLHATITLFDNLFVLSDTLLRYDYGVFVTLYFFYKMLSVFVFLKFAMTKNL